MSFSQFPLVVLLLSPCPSSSAPHVLLSAGFPQDSYKGCCRIPTRFLQAFYRVPTCFLWVPIGLLHNSYRVPMGSLQGSYRVPTGLLWASYRLLMGSYRIIVRFLWGSYRVPTAYCFDIVCHSSSVLLIFLLSYFVLLPLPSCPSSSVLLSFFLCPLVLLSFSSCCSYFVPLSFFLCPFLQDSYRIPTGQRKKDKRTEEEGQYSRGKRTKYEKEEGQEDTGRMTTNIKGRNCRNPVGTP